MAKYQCSICGFIYDDEKETVLFCSLPDDWTCPMCGAPKNLFQKIEEPEETMPHESSSLDYETAYFKPSSKEEPHMAMIHEMAVTGKSVIAPMSSDLACPLWDDILFLGAQLNPAPLADKEEVTTQTVIGKNAKQPMILEMPLYISHMSFGALSKEAKIALAEASALVKTATCSGEGGILEEEITAASHYIFEYVPNLYSVTDENLKRASAIEIKIGQGTKPGMGGHLPKEKVTEEISQIRNKPMGEDIISPSKFSNLTTKEALKDLVDHLREVSLGRPIGIKIAAGHMERDLEWICYANPDFITIDGRGGATGASPKLLRDASSVPTIYALYRAKKYLEEHQSDIDIVITGGLRVSSDFAKAIAMGATAVALSSSILMALSCQQYRLCHKGTCPVGIATQDQDLRNRLPVSKGSLRVANFLKVSNEELKMFARITGHKKIHDLSSFDLVTINEEISNHTNIPHV